MTLPPPPDGLTGVTGVDGIDRMDAKLIGCLQLSPRARFSTIGAALDISEQTAARRYRRLRDSGAVRVRGKLASAAAGQNSWLIRVQCSPGSGAQVADVLAERSETRQVVLCSGGGEVLCTVRTAADQGDLPLAGDTATAPVLAVSHSLVLHRFTDDAVRDWLGRQGALTEAQQRLLTTASPTADLPATACPPAVDKPAALEDGDRALLDLLLVDGRATVAALAKATGLSEGRTTRRLSALIGSGALRLHVDIAPGLLGDAAGAVLWIGVAPAHLDAAGRILAGHPQVTAAAAISGGRNLAAAVRCRDTADLYAFVTGTVGQLAGVHAVEVSPVLRRVDSVAS